MIIYATLETNTITNEEKTMDIIQWCNDNTGFLTAILSLIGLVISITAIVVSIRTARMPYKKKLQLGSSVLIGTGIVPGERISTSIIGLSASATNIGNRTINITYLGYAVNKNGRFNMFYPINREFDSKATLMPSEISESQFYKEELIKCLSREDSNAILYVFAKDTEGKEYKLKTGTVGKLLDKLSL